MDAFATTDQVDEKTQGAIPSDTPFLIDELLAASRTIRNYCRWHVATIESGLIRRHRTRLREDVWLPAMQIVSIDSVTVDGKSIDITTVDFDPETGWTSLRGSVVDVTYTAGYAEIPEDLTALTVKLAIRSLTNIVGAIRDQTGPSNVAYSQVAPNVAADGSLLAHEMAQLDHYRVAWLP